MPALAIESYLLLIEVYCDPCVPMKRSLSKV